MTMNKFNLIFIIAVGIILTLVDYYNKIEILSKYLIIVILIAYYIGQYSTRFSKKED
jgi:hypothetical protein